MHANNILKFLFWNAQSITSKTKQIQLEHILEIEKIDICLLVETFLKPQHTFQLKNFIVIGTTDLHTHTEVLLSLFATTSHTSLVHRLTPVLSKTLLSKSK